MDAIPVFYKERTGAGIESHHFSMSRSIDLVKPENYETLKSAFNLGKDFYIIIERDYSVSETQENLFVVTANDREEKKAERSPSVSLLERELDSVKSENEKLKGIIKKETEKNFSEETHMDSQESYFKYILNRGYGSLKGIFKG